MKILIAICFGVCFQVMGWQNTATVPVDFANAPNPAPLFDETCTLTITGYATYEGHGRPLVTMTSEAATCEEAAAELREQIVKRELRIAK